MSLSTNERHIMKHTFSIALDSGEFFHRCLDDNGNEYEQLADFKAYDALANGFMWCMQVKHKGQRKFHNKGPVTRSIYAMLDTVRAEFVAGASATVVCVTPDVEITFFLS